MGNQQRPAGLSEVSLIEAALRHIERVGLENLTMRGLASETGVTQMAAYYHFKNKQELLTGVADWILSQIADTSQREGTWDERLRGLATDMVAELARWPGVAALLMRMDPAPPHANRLIDNAVTTLVDAGFSPAEAQMAGSMLAAWSLGAVAWSDGRASGFVHPFSPAQDDGAGIAPAFVDFALTAMLTGLRDVLVPTRR